MVRVTWRHGSLGSSAFWMAGRSCRCSRASRPLRNEVQALRGEIEVQSNTIAQLRERQRELYLGLDERLLGLEQASPPVLADSGVSADSGISADSRVVGDSGVPADAGEFADSGVPADAGLPLPTEVESDSVESDFVESGFMEFDSVADAGVIEAPSGPDASTGEVAVLDLPVTVETGEDRAVTIDTNEFDTADTGPANEADLATVAMTLDPVSEQQDYQAAFDLLKGGRYHDAAKAFQTFLAIYPGGEFVDNAHYWLGETYYVNRQFEAALLQFQDLISRFPQSPKLTHAMLKIGYVHHELGRLEEARQALLDLVERHPDSTAAGLARKRLKRLQSG